MKAKIFFLVLLVALASPLLAKARYYKAAEMIQRADVIAVVHVLELETAKQQGEYWVYYQRAVLKRERVLKGQYLVFLIRDKNGFLVSANHEDGLVPIEDNMAQWSTEGGYGERKAVPLEELENGILAEVKR